MLTPNALPDTLRRRFWRRPSKSPHCRLSKPFKATTTANPCSPHWIKCAILSVRCILMLWLAELSACPPQAFEPDGLLSARASINTTSLLFESFRRVRIPATFSSSAAEKKTITLMARLASLAFL